MIRYRILPLFFLLFVVSCVTPSAVQIPEYLNQKIFKDKDVLYLEAINLTEDASVLSTKDDEVLIFFYRLDGDELGELLFSKNQVFSKGSFNHVVINCEEGDEGYLLVLLEQDSDLSIDAFDGIIRAHIDQMKKDQVNKDYESIESYLGDDDIIAIQKIATIGNQSYDHQGSHRGDRFHYRSVFMVR